MIDISVEVNGKTYMSSVRDNMTLLEYIRNELGMTGTKKGCGVGECGACTVIMDGKAVDSCLVYVFQADGSKITTIEGLSEDGALDTIQEAFIEMGSVQCGYCTPGMIISARAMLNNKNKPTREEIRKAISGNLCRCTGYTKIIKAIELAVEKQK